MLVLRRKINERIVITASEPATITVVLVDTESGSSRLGFVAPPSVTVNRQEVEESKQRDLAERPAPKPDRIAKLTAELAAMTAQREYYRVEAAGLAREVEMLRRGS